MTSESDDQMVFKGSIDSPPCAEEDSSGGSFGLNGVGLKKGPWTSTEDAILVAYVTKHGEGNWNGVQKYSGLARCGKSCRLRWTNHLRPDLKKGAFTPEEERRIIELHAKMGNKWAKMALELPGRTDNEIKNYWNTRIKRRQRAGLPIYPPDICLHALNDNQSENMYAFSSGNNNNNNNNNNPHDPDLSTSEYPTVEFKKYDLNQRFYLPPVLNIPPSNLHATPFPAEDYLLSPFQPNKRIRHSESSLLPGLSSGLTKIHKDGSSVPNFQSMWIDSKYYHNPALDYAPLSCVMSDSHAIPSSEPTWAMKELPSLQTQTGSCWTTGQPPPSSTLPSLESFDAALFMEHTEESSGGLQSTRNSGLLDAVLYGSQSLITPMNDPCQQKLEISTVHEEEVFGTSACYDDDDDDVVEWDWYKDPNSPLGQSAASVFSNYTPGSGSSLDEFQSFEIFQGSELYNEEMMIPTIFVDQNNNNSISNKLDRTKGYMADFYF